jgi:hypothetical protein
MTPASESGVDLYWRPLGAGGHSARLHGHLFEAVAARLERRAPCDLGAGGAGAGSRFVIE